MVRAGHGEPDPADRPGLAAWIQGVYLDSKAVDCWADDGGVVS